LSRSRSPPPQRRRSPPRDDRRRRSPERARRQSRSPSPRRRHSPPPDRARRTSPKYQEYRREDPPRQNWRPADEEVSDDDIKAENFQEYRRLLREKKAKRGVGSLWNHSPTPEREVEASEPGKPLFPIKHKKENGEKHDDRRKSEDNATEETTKKEGKLEKPKKKAGKKKKKAPTPDSDSSDSEEDKKRKKKPSKKRSSRKAKRGKKKKKVESSSSSSSSPSSSSSSSSGSDSEGDKGGKDKGGKDGEPGEDPPSDMDDEDAQLFREFMAQQRAAVKPVEEEEAFVGPALPPQKASVDVNYGGALLPGEGDAMAAYVQSGKRIPRRGEVGLSADEIQHFEDIGYVMSGSRHSRMNAIRIRKENQVYTAEEKAALAMINHEEQMAREQKVLADLRKLVERHLGDGADADADA